MVLNAILRLHDLLYVYDIYLGIYSYRQIQLYMCDVLKSARKETHIPLEDRTAVVQTVT